MSNDRWSNDNMIIGQDNANNIVATTNVAANADGTILERLEFIQSETERDNGRGGNIWYLDSGATGTADGTSWTNAWDTLATAVAGASAYDTILVKDGSTYDIGAAQDITLNGLHIIGTGVKEPNFAKALIYGGTGHFITINAHEVLIDNIGFDGPLDTYDAIRIGTSAEPFKVKISNCKFDLTNGEIGVRVGDPTYDCPDAVVENCLFRSFSTCGVYVSSTRAKIINNIFLVDANVIGIDIYQHEGDRPDLVIKDNVITGANSGDTGIKFSYTNSEDEITMVGNSVTNCATPITLAKYTSWYDGNYWGVDDAAYHATTNDSGSKVFYVDSDAATTGLDGRCWASAFNLPSEAITAISATTHCSVYIKKGIYTEAAVLDLAVEGTKFYGQNKTGDMWGTTSIKDTTGHTIMSVNANECEIHNLSFIQNTANPIITVGNTSTCYKTIIKGCHFNGGGTQTYGVNVGGTGVGGDGVDTHVSDCTFVGCATAGFYMYGTRNVCRNNVFLLADSVIAIEYPQGGGVRPSGRIIDNVIHGYGIGDTGIKLGGTPSTFLLTIVGNEVHHVATPITIGKNIAWYEGNDWGTNSFFIPGRVYTIKNTGVLMNAATMNVFTITGGAIEILSYFGQCTVDFAAPGNFTVGVDATLGVNYDADFSTTVDADAIDVGDVVTFHTTTAGESVLDPTVNVNAGDQLSWFCPAGVVLHTHTTSAGAATWYMTFRVLDAGVTVATA